MGLGVTLLFTVLVPSPPRRALLAALAALGGVPLMAAISLAMHPPPHVPTTAEFFFLFSFPYLLVGLMAYVGARVVFGLGTEVRKARQPGSYHLLERIGQGGMGEVWRARHRLLASRGHQAHSSARGAVNRRIRSGEPVRAGSASNRERMVKKFGPLPAERVIHVVRQMCRSSSSVQTFSRAIERRE